jgi:hypothetical protein
MTFNLREQRTGTFWATIFMAGFVETAKQVCREYCFEVGLCVTVEPTLYIYTGGEESGFRVGLIDYPRFPKASDEILVHAEALADRLRARLCQHSYTIMIPAATIWRTTRDARDDGGK